MPATVSPPDHSTAVRLYVAPNQLVPNPWNRELDDNDPTLTELGEDITRKGQIYPCIVRTHPKDDQQMQIVLGERRWRACRKATIDVWVEVREMDDKTAVELIFSENMQRKDLSPLQESSAVCAMIDNGWLPEEVADRCGKPVRWVYRRARLSKLSKKWQKEIDKDARHFSALMLEEVAVLAPDAQDKLLAELGGRMSWIGLQELRREVGRLTRELARAPFDVHDAKLPGGACATCDKRASCQPHLFEPKPEALSANDRCLDAVCWERKEVARIKRVVKDVEKEHKRKPLLIGNVYTTNSVRNRGLKPTLSSFEARQIKQDAKGAVPAVNLETGEVVFVANPRSRKPQDADKPAQKRNARAEAEDRKRKREAFVREESLRQWKHACATRLTLQQLAAVAASFGAMVQDTEAVNKPWMTLDRIDGDKDRIRKALAEPLFVAAEDASHCCDDPERAWGAFLKFARVDLAAIVKQAAAKFPEPDTKGAKA